MIYAIYNDCFIMMEIGEISGSKCLKYLLQYVRGQEFIFSSRLSGFSVVVKWKMIVTKMSNYELRELKHWHKQGKTLWIMGHFYVLYCRCFCIAHMNFLFMLFACFCDNKNFSYQRSRVSGEMELAFGQRFISNYNSHVRLFRYFCIFCKASLSHADTTYKWLCDRKSNEKCLPRDGTFKI